jgi:hypothetical protein
MRYLWALAATAGFLVGSESWLPNDKLVATTELPSFRSSGQVTTAGFQSSV